MEWPDGGSYLTQLALVPELWELIADEIRLYKKERERK